MKVPIYRTYSSQVALLTIACFLHATIGCGGAPASGTVFIRVTDPAGQITEKTFTHEEFATSAKGSVDQLMAPDEASIDPARILSEGSVSLKLASGKVLELKTEGNRVALADGTNAASLSWNVDRTELTIETPGGRSKVELTGAHDPAEVARFVGNTAIGLFAVLADPTLAASMATGERPYCGPCVVFIILIIGWLACNRGVRNVWMDCGISYRNGWQFGFGCTIECW